MFTKYTPFPEQCKDPEHNPPSMIVLKPGTHTWECPSCGQESTFTVPDFSLRYIPNTKHISNPLQESESSEHGTTTENGPNH